MTRLLNAENLHVIFEPDEKKIHAVRGVTFSIEEGEMVALVGESGSGKSVLAKSLLRLLPPRQSLVFADSLKLLDNDLQRIGHKEFLRICGNEIAMIFQDPMSSLNPTMKIGAQIGECIRKAHPELTKSEVKNQVLEHLVRVKLPDPYRHVDEYPFQLSGGMCQRVAIAMAFAFSPRIIIADEPTTALDATLRMSILELMQDLQQQTGTSILFITHDLSLVSGYCDRVLVMYAGKIVESGPVEDIFARPAHPYTIRLLQSLPRIDGALEDLMPIDGKPPELSEPIDGCAFAPRCTKTMPVCRRSCPSDSFIETGHTAACWLHTNNHEED